MSSTHQAGERHNLLIGSCRDIRHIRRVLPALILDMLDDDRWRRLVRPIDGKEFHHERIETWLLGDAWGGLGFKSWGELYEILEFCTDGKEAIEALRARGAP